jgi:hypothetical protein
VGILGAFRQRGAGKVRTLMESHTNARMERILSQLKSKGKKELAKMAYENSEAKRDAEVKLRHLPHCGRPKRVTK